MCFQAGWGKRSISLVSAERGRVLEGRAASKSSRGVTESAARVCARESVQAQENQRASTATQPLGSRGPQAVPPSLRCRTELLREQLLWRLCFAFTPRRDSPNPHTQPLQIEYTCIKEQPWKGEPSEVF